jgi:hypothetical protein
MKRKVEEGVIESIAIPDEVWEGTIFPFLYKEMVRFWLSLCLVSKKWLEMIGRNRKVVLKGIESVIVSGRRKFILLSQRFGRVSSMTAELSSLDHLDHDKFPLLKKLTLFGDFGFSGYRGDLWNVGKLTNLTSLVVPTAVSGLEKLKNLTHLSAMYLNSNTYDRMVPGVNQLKIKHLCLGSIGSRSVLDLSVMMPSDQASLEYLESNDRSLFVNTQYTGRGKWTSGFPKIYYHYEGEWLGGERHGRGSIMERGNFIIGEWVDDVIIRGSITYKNGSFYSGDLFGIAEIKPHGRGVLYDSKLGERYDGEFVNGVRQGWGRLHQNDLLVYDGHWEQGDQFDLNLSSL